MATIRIRFHKVDRERFTMLFGDSYKPWKEQYKEYLRLNRDKVMPILAEKSNSQWIGWGGLKWCEEKDFQHLLNREDRQDDDTDNPLPRKYANFIFKEIQLPTNSQLENY